MNRRGFLTLGLKSAVLAVAMTTGLSRVSLELVKAPLSLSELISQTLRKHQAQLIANVEAHNTLFSSLIKAGGYSSSLGELITEPVQYAEPSGDFEEMVWPDQEWPISRAAA